MKVFLSTPGVQYANWIPERMIVDSLQEADLLIITGGEDVDPKLYGDIKHHTTYTSQYRDEYESQLFKDALQLRKPILGICRGSQLTCVMAGGKLIQDQNNPSYIHKMKTFDGLELDISSTHHQAQHPFNLPKEDYEILAWSEGLINYRKNGSDQEMETAKDCEVVYYHKYNALAIQGHPEMMFGNKEYQPTIDWCIKQLDLLK